MKTVDILKEAHRLQYIIEDEFHSLTENEKIVMLKTVTAAIDYNMMQAISIEHLKNSLNLEG